jgi:polygalacturonase
MSGGAKNIFLYNCSFIGTDKGLRFKSTRGRGGIVENIYARDLIMKDIKDEAIYFDLYYFVQFATDGVRDNRPEVNAGTPIFRNMHFDNIACNGAKKAIFIRGLPEMPVTGIHISNCTLNADSGAELVDAGNITFENIRFNIVSKDYVIQADNVIGLRASALHYPGGINKLLKVSGNRSKSINMSGTGSVIAVTDIETGDDVPAGTVQLK